MKEPNVRYSMKGDGVDCSKLGAINAQSAVSKTDTCNTRAQTERFDPSVSSIADLWLSVLGGKQLRG